MTREHEYPDIKRRQFIAMTGAVGGAAATAGCGGTPTTGTDAPADGSTPSDGQQGGEFIDTRSEAANTLDPRTNELAWVSGMLPYVFDGLFIQSPDGSEMVPHLASEMPTEEDETTYTVPLREGVQFHDGEELTAEDIAYTLNWILDPDNGSVRRQSIEFMDSVEVVDDHVVRVNLDNPYALFEQALSEPIVAKSVAEDLGSEEFGRQPVGSGPFQFAEWEQSDHITLERFDDYFLQTPNLDAYTVRIIPEAQVQFVELATGAVHQASVPHQLSGKAREEDGIEMTAVDHFDYNGLIFNSLREPFDDVRVREAMQYAVDYDELLEATKGDLGSRAYGFMPKSVNEAWDFPWEEWDEEFFPEKDHEEARRLLEEAGYGDGFGRTIEIKSLSSEKFKPLAIILQNQLQELGFEAEVQELTIGQWIESLNTDTYDVNIYGWGGGEDPDGYYYFLFRDLRNDQGFDDEDWDGNSSAGMLHVASPDDEGLDRVDEIAREARTTLDREQRREMYVEAAEILQSRYPHIQVFSEADLTAWSSSVQDYELTSYSSQPLCNQWNNAWIDE
jgi:peptide/nickel transport system substrate-binding protein